MMARHSQQEELLPRGSEAYRPACRLLGVELLSTAQLVDLLGNVALCLR